MSNSDVPPMEYRIAKSGSTDGLEAEVESLLEQGYTLLGGMASDAYGFYQALVRVKREEKT